MLLIEQDFVCSKEMNFKHQVAVDMAEAEADRRGIGSLVLEFMGLERSRKRLEFLGLNILYVKKYLYV